jgi:DNA mismatch repair protein MutL
MQAKRIDPQVQLYNFSQLFNTFIVFQSETEMFIADQHTVHERLNYEKFMQKLREKKLEVQPLLVPVTVELSAKEAQVLRSSFEALLELGLEVAPFGGNTFLVRSVPADLAGKNVVALIKDLVDDLAAQDASGVKSTNRFDQARERAATFMSCRSAVMAGDRLNEDQMKGLIERMREANLPFTCPHGRPTIMSIPLSELYRRFDRH